jgi:hypothetical protein
MSIDYRSFSSDGNKYSPTSNPYASQWWKAPKSERAQAVASTVKSIAEYDSKRQTQYQISARLYGNSDLMGLNGISFSKVQSVQGAVKDRLTYNVCQSVVDTITSKIAKNKPKPMFLTKGGDYRLQKKAKKLDKFVEGVFYENRAHSLGNIIFRDASVSGDGLVHVFAKDGRVKYERVLASEIYVDWVDGFYNDPRQIHRVKNIDRNVLLDLFPDKKAIIQNANSASADLTGVNRTISDCVTVMESWHLKSGLEATDGLHTINIVEENLFEEKWDKPYFPFAHLKWSPRLYGFWGQGLVEQIQNIQLEINKILWVIQRSFHLAGSFKILIENGSKIVKEYLNNDIGAIVSYSGVEPKYIVPQIVANEMYQHLLTLKNSAYEQAGISQLSANSQKPAGLNSGKALREYNDIESDRFMTVGQAYERFFLDLSVLTVDCAKTIFENDRSFSVKVPGNKFIETINWKDVNLEEDEYEMKIYPVSSLPDEPAGRLQTIQEYMQAGIFSVRTGRRLLDFPDLDQVEELATAAEDYLNEILEKIIEDGEFTPPEPYDDLGLARELALQFYAKGKTSGLEEEKLDLLRQFMDQLDVLEQKAAQSLQPQPGQPQSQPQPQANPQPTPTNDLIPNVAGAA